MAYFIWWSDPTADDWKVVRPTRRLFLSRLTAACASIEGGGISDVNMWRWLHHYIVCCAGIYEWAGGCAPGILKLVMVLSLNLQRSSECTHGVHVEASYLGSEDDLFGGPILSPSVEGVAD